MIPSPWFGIPCATLWFRSETRVCQAWCYYSGIWRRALSQALVLLQVARSRNWARTPGLGPFPEQVRDGLLADRCRRDLFSSTKERACLAANENTGSFSTSPPITKPALSTSVRLERASKSGQVSCGIRIGCSLVASYFKLLYHHVQLHPTRIRLRPPPIHCFEMVRRLQHHA